LVNWISTFKRIQLEAYLTPYTEINSKCIIDLLKVRANTIKLLEVNTGVNICDLGLGSGF